MDTTLLEFVAKLGEQKPEDLKVEAMPPLLWAYLGDAVYEMYVRTTLLHREQYKVHRLHKLATCMVKASAQSDILHFLEPRLTEQEQDIARRGRNAKAKHSAKNASEIEYRRSTGFEALIGYLYLRGNHSRLQEILGHATEWFDHQNPPATTEAKEGNDNESRTSKPHART